MSGTGAVAHGTGIGFCGLLTVLFVGLKLTDYVDWSWWWVLSPIWIQICLVVVVLIIICIGLFIAYLIGEYG